MTVVIFTMFIISYGFGICCFVLDAVFDLNNNMFKAGAVSLCISILFILLGLFLSAMEVN